MNFWSKKPYDQKSFHNSRIWLNGHGVNITYFRIIRSLEKNSCLDCRPAIPLLEIPVRCVK